MAHFVCFGTHYFQAGSLGAIQLLRLWLSYLYLANSIIFINIPKRYVSGFNSASQITNRTKA
jgi:hypothetical protein